MERCKVCNAGVLQYCEPDCPEWDRRWDEIEDYESNLYSEPNEYDDDKSRDSWEK